MAQGFLFTRWEIICTSYLEKPLYLLILLQESSCQNKTFNWDLTNLMWFSRPQNFAPAKFRAAAKNEKSSAARREKLQIILKISQICQAKKWSEKCIKIQILTQFWLKFRFENFANKHCNVLNFGKKFGKFYQKCEIYKRNFNQNRKQLWFWLIFRLYILQIYFLKLRKNEAKN